MPRRNNPWVTFLMFLGVCALGYGAYHFVAVEKVFEKRTVEAPPESVIERIRTSLEEGLAPDDCFDHVGGIGWRPASQRFRVGVEIRDGCGNDAARRIAGRAQELVERSTNGKHVAEVEITALGRQLYLSLPR